MTSIARASLSSLVAVSLLWIGCGGAQTRTSASAGGASWDDLCTLAEARLKRCKISSDIAVQSVAKCGDLTTCLGGDVYDPGAAALLKTCLASDDCDACTKAAAAAPSPAAKAYTAKITKLAPSCSAFDPNSPYPGGSMSAIYGAKAYGLFDACLGQKCAEAAGCIGTTVVSNEPLITCEQYLGLDATAGDQ